MENLFSTNLSIDNKKVSYHVFFDQVKYTFEPEVKEEPFPSFSFKREHDEWHEQSNLSGSPNLAQVCGISFCANGYLCLTIVPL